MYSQLTTIGTRTPFKSGRIWESDNYRFADKDIRGHFDEVEEQMWAIRGGIGLQPNFVFTIELRKNRSGRFRVKRIPR